MVNKECLALGSQRSAIRELFEYGKQRAAVVGAENVFDYSIGNPSVPAPVCVKEAIATVLATLPDKEVHGYTNAAGDPALRADLAAYNNQIYDLQTTAADYYITCGAAAALTIVLHAIYTGPTNTVLAIAPFFPEYRVFVEATGAQFDVVPADTEKFQINFEALEAKLTEDVTALIIDSPNNPSGAVYSEKSLLRLSQLLSRKEVEFGHPIYLISDEPYREIVFDDLQVPFVTKYYDDTIVCYSYSKTLSLPGERIGWVLVPQAAADADALLAAVAGAGRALGFVNAPSLTQHVLRRCLGQHSDISVYEQNRNLLYASLTDMGYHCVRPQGTFYMFLKAPEEDANAFCARAQALDLLMVPADSFGCPGWARISFCVETDMIRRSLPAFQKLAESYGIKEQM